MGVSADQVFDGLLLSFELSCRSRNLSPKTIKAYVESTLLFADFVEREGFGTDLASIRRQHVEAFIADQLDRWTPSTAATRFRCLQQFFRFATDEGEIPTNPMASMRPPKVVDEPVDVISDADVRALLATCASNDFLDRRDEAVMRVFLDTGVRLNELVGMTIEALDLRVRATIVTGKGGYMRTVSFGDKTTRALDRYLRARRKHRLAELDALWIAPKGPLGDSGVTQLLRRRCREAGIGAVHPHQWRHTFAHKWLASGGNEGDLQTLAGWRSQQMLARYGASAKAERAAAAHTRYSPGDQF